jgi:hypothetical protein
VAVAYACGRCGKRSSEPGRCDDDGIELAPTDDPLIGTDCSRYRLVRLLGRGGMGRVYLAIQPAIRSRVAVKLLAEDLVHDATLVGRFFAEARTVNLIQHEHIVDILDLDRLPGGRPFIVMEYIDGRTLRELIAAGPAPIGAALRTAIDVLGGLAAAHAAGVVHRDLKPDNIMVTHAGHTKILDFGIAKLVGDGASHRTTTGVAVGTPHYMAPEQVLGGAVDARTDVYAMGLVLHELLVGARPFDGDSDFQLMSAQLHAAPPPVRALRGDVPEAVERVVLRALAKQPADRFAGAAEMSAALRAASAGLPAESWPRAIAEAPTAVDRSSLATAQTVADMPAARRPPAPAPMPPPAQARWPRRVGFAGLAAAVVAVVVVALSIGGRDEPATALAPLPPTLPSPSPLDAAPPSLDAAIAPPADAAPPDASRPANAVAPGTATPIGRSCTSPADCPTYGCDCNGGATSTATLFTSCDHGRCLLPAASCTRACAGFHGTWTGGYRVKVPVISADCASAPNCKRDRECVARRLASSATDTTGDLQCVTGCRQMTQCELFGRCVDGSDGQSCVVGAQRDCAASNACASAGACEVVDGVCAIASDADCVRAPACVNDGQCTFTGGKCIAGSAADCARSACAGYGGCVVRDGACGPGSAADCASSLWCRKAGFCAMVDGACAVTQAGCQASEMCANGGACTARRGECER